MKASDPPFDNPLVDTHALSVDRRRGASDNRMGTAVGRDRVFACG